MVQHLNTEADIAAFVGTIQQDVMFVIHETAVMRGLVAFRNDRAGAAPRAGREYGAGTAKTIGESDDLTSDAFTPSAGQTLTPAEIGEQFFLTDLRIETEGQTEQGQVDIRTEASRELGFAAVDKIESDLCGDLANLTGGTIGAAGSVMSWGYFFAAASVLRTAVKNRSIPLTCVLHDYQWHPLAKAASVAGASVVNAPAFQDSVMRNWYVGTVSGVNIFTTSNITIDGSGDAKGGMFIPDAIMYDERRAIRLEPQRDASRRGWEMNMSGVYAHGVWRPAHGIVLYTDAATPAS